MVDMRVKYCYWLLSGNVPSVLWTEFLMAVNASAAVIDILLITFWKQLWQRSSQLYSQHHSTEHHQISLHLSLEKGQCCCMVLGLCQEMRLYSSSALLCSLWPTPTPSLQLRMICLSLQGIVTMVVFIVQLYYTLCSSTLSFRMEERSLHQHVLAALLAVL